MKTLVVYDSVFGNTEKVALAIADVFQEGENKVAHRVNQVDPQKIKGIELLIVGSPTRKFQATPGIRNFIRHIPRSTMEGVQVAAFDTRISTRDVKSSLLRLLLDFFGYAAPQLLRRMKRKGGIIITEPEGFFVRDSEGPMYEGELDRAGNWGRELKEKIRSTVMA